MSGWSDRRQRTRDGLRRAALELFERQGYDATSVRDVAAAAGVTERTFYRHFPTKDAVLFQRSRDRFDALGAILVAHVDVDRPTWTDIRVALEKYAISLEADTDGLEKTARAVYASPSLASRRREHRSLWIDWLSQALAPEDENVHTAFLAPVIIATINRAQEIWVVAGGTMTLAAAMARAVDEARAAMPVDSLT